MEANSKIHKQRGAVMIEFALISLFVLIPLLFGIIELSIICYDKAMITNASREGARAGIVYNDPRLDAPGITTVVNNYCQARLISFGSDMLSVDVSGPCPAGTGVGASITVTVNYQYEWLVVPNFLATLVGPVNLSATAVMRCE